MTNIDSNFKERLLIALDKYRGLGEIVHPNGTMSIGKIPDKEKWFLCHLYHGMTDEEMQKVESGIGRPLPRSLKALYGQFNGMRLFGAGQFSVWGYRGSAPMEMPNYQPIPLTLSHLDVFPRISNAPTDAIYFAEYCGKYVFYVTTHSDRVSACREPDATPIEQWKDAESMVLDVAQRLSVWFDENAQPVDPAVNERPVLFERTAPRAR